MSHEAADQGRARDCIVLVIDDDEDQRAAMADLLGQRGYTVLVASDGQDALEMLERGLRPTLIVLDLTMPRMDGRAFLDYLRRSALATVPVIVASAAARDGAAPEGASAVLAKPVEPARLRAEVARLTLH